MGEEAEVDGGAACGGGAAAIASNAGMGTPKAMVSDEQGFHGVHAHTLYPHVARENFSLGTIHCVSPSTLSQGSH